MKLGEIVRFYANDKEWVLQPFTLGTWLEFAEWCKANIQDDPVGRVNRLQLEKLSPEMANQLVKDAIAEDKKVNDYRPESEACVNRLGTPGGLLQAIYLLAGGPQGRVSKQDVDTMVSGFVFGGQTQVLMDYVNRTIGTPAKSAEKN